MASINYIILKSIIETTLKNYNAKERIYPVNENNIFLVGLSPSGLDLMIQCPKTGKQTNIHAEVNFMNVDQNGISGQPNTNPVFTQPIQQPTKKEGTISDSDVMDVRQALKTKGSIRDLFGDSDASS